MDGSTTKDVGLDKRLVVLLYIVKLILMTAFAIIFIYVLSRELAPELKELWVSLLSVTLSNIFGEVVKKKTQHINLIGGIDEVDSVVRPLKKPSVRRKLFDDDTCSLK